MSVVFYPHPYLLAYDPRMPGRTGIVEDIKYEIFSVQAQVRLNDPLPYKPPLELVWENTLNWRLKHTPDVFLYDWLFRREITSLHQKHYVDLDTNQFISWLHYSDWEIEQWVALHHRQHLHQLPNDIPYRNVPLRQYRAGAEQRAVMPPPPTLPLPTLPDEP